MNSPDPIVSIIVPCYKQAHLLPQAVRSVQVQSVDSWELLVVDDGSPDNTAEATAALSSVDPRVRLIRKPNGGLSSARNAGLNAAKGRYIQFLDADDLLLPDKFKRALDAIEGAGGPALAIDDFAFLGADGSTFGSALCRPRFETADFELELSVRWELELSIPIHCPIVSTDLFRGPKGLRFDERLPNHEDFAFWMRTMALRPFVVTTGHTGALYRINPAGMTRNRQQMYKGFAMAIQARLADKSVRPIVRDALKAKLAVVRHQYGHGLRGRAHELLQRPTWRRAVPWPLQRALLEGALVDPQAHQAALSRKFGLQPVR